MLTACIWIMRHQSVFEGFAETTASGIMSVNFSSLKSLIDIPKDSLSILKPQLNKVVKSVDPNAPEQNTADGLTLDVDFIKNNGHTGISDSEAEKLVSQYHNINYILMTLKEIHPAAYKMMIQ